MNTDVHSKDAAAIPLWNEAYDPSQLHGQGNLWGDPPVPYAEKAARLFAENSAAVVLDLPCGDGRNLPPLSAGAPVVLGGDTSEKAMTIAAGVAEKAGIRNNVVFVKMDAFATGLLDDSVDGIFCWDLLGHLTEPTGALREMHRITRPGGLIVANMWTMNDCQVTDPNIRKTGPKQFVDHFDFYCEFYDQAGLGRDVRRVRRDRALVGAPARRLPRLRARAREPDFHGTEVRGLRVLGRV